MAEEQPLHGRGNRGRRIAAITAAAVAVAVLIIAASVARTEGRSVLVATTATDVTTSTISSEPSTTSGPATTVALPANTTPPASASRPAAAPYANPPVAPPTSSPPPSSTEPQPGDFSGTLTVAQPSIAVGETDYVELEIRNTTDHVVEPSLGSNLNGVAIICAPDLSADGRTTRTLVSNENLFFVTSLPVGPGERTGRGGHYSATVDDLATVTCEAAIVTSSDNWATMTVVGRVTNVAPASFQVLATPPTTS